MKIKIEKKIFDAFFRQFITKGKLRRAATESSQIEFAYIEAKGTQIKVSSRKRNQKIMIRGILEGEVLEEGEFQITDLDSFLGELKGLSGKYYEITFDKNITVVSGGKKYSFPFNLVPADAALLIKLKAWDSTHYKDKGIIKFDVKGTAYPFTPWFKLKDSSQLTSIPDDLFNRTKIDMVEVETTNEIIFSADNATDKRQYYNDEIDDIEILNATKMVLKDDIFPLLKSLSGEAEFQYYVTTKGSNNIWVECNNMEWQITIKP